MMRSQPQLDPARIVALGRALTSQLERESIFSALTAQMAERLGARAWSLLLVDPGDPAGALSFSLVVSPVAEQLLGLRLRPGQGVAGWVALNGEPLLIADVQRDPRYSPQFDLGSNFITRSLACVPLRGRDGVLGVIEWINPYDDAFCDDDLPVLQAIADFTAIALDHARTFSALQQLVITDDLTGLYNARHLQRLIDYEVDRARRYHSAVSVVFIDIDRFKLVNDSHGHLVGSRLLAQFGQFLREKLRRVDHAARYGGDEFVLILPETDKAGALILCNHLREQLRSHPFTAEDGTPLCVTASFGIASLPEDASDKTELLRLADRLMYEVKESSRDGVRAR